MIQRKYETIVGIFVVASLAILLLMVLVIAKQERLWERHVAYHAIFKNVSGLKIDSEVRLAGVTVGNVKATNIDPQGNIVVTFEVVDKYASRLRKDSRASIGYNGLLGDKSLDLTAGSTELPVIPPEGIVTSIEPLDFTEIFAKAAPNLESLQKVLTNLAEITAPKSSLNQSLDDLSRVMDKVNREQGTLGLLVNNPDLYREASQAATGVRKFSVNLQSGQGLIPALVNDPALKGEAQKTLTDLHATFASLKESAARLPEVVENLRRASRGLPDLVVSGEGMVSDVDQVAQAAKKSWLLRRNVPKPKERSIRVDRDPGRNTE
jgi:phospholipid/cholesterol/gamma-HCH transport system substrate-binding protein